MLRFNKILCPVDFSEFSEMALRYAVSLASHYESQLIVLHSLPDPVLLAGYSNTIPPFKYDWTIANEALDDLTARIIPPELSFYKRTDVGAPAKTILKTAEEEGIDLIVIGTHGMSGFESFLIGSVTNRVLHKCKIPVLVVCRPQRDFLTGDPNRPVKINQIICAVMPDSHPLRLVNLALSIAKQFQAKILFYQVQETQDSEHNPESTFDSIKEIVTREDLDWCDIRFLTQKGDPAQWILNAAREYRADLMFVGHHTRRPAALEVLGSVALKVIRESPCPVTVVRE